jgi:uncharacterized protein YbjT (DUF2867 family)
MPDDDVSLSEDSILLTGATGQVGRATIEALVQKGVKPTALVRKDTPLEGCVTVSDWLTSERASIALGRATVVVHLAGNLNPPDHDYERANIVPTRRVASAVDSGRARRLIFLSYVGASEHSANRYLATKARAERMLQETGVPLTVLRCTHIIGSPQHPGPTALTLLADGKKSVKVLGNGRQRVVPVYLGDVVAAIDAAIRSDHTGTFDLQGPDEMSFDDLVRLVNGTTKVSIAHVPLVLAPLLQFVGPKLPGPLIDVMVHDSRSDHPTAHLVLGLSLRHLGQVWLRRRL